MAAAPFSALPAEVVPRGVAGGVSFPSRRADAVSLNALSFSFAEAKHEGETRRVCEVALEVERELAVEEADVEAGEYGSPASALVCKERSRRDGVHDDFLARMGVTRAPQTC